MLVEERLSGPQSIMNPADAEVVLLGYLALRCLVFKIAKAQVGSITPGHDGSAILFVMALVGCVALGHSLVIEED